MHGEFNGYKGERMESQGHVNKDGVSEFVLERHLSPGLYNYYFLIDGRKRIDVTKPVVGKGSDKRNVITVCNPSILGAQGGPFMDGRLAAKNFDAVAAYGGDISTIMENSSVDLAAKVKRSRQGSRSGSNAAYSSSNSSRPGSTVDGQHRLNAIMTPTNEGMSATWNPRGGRKMKSVLLVHNLVCDDGAWALGNALIDNHRVTELDLSTNLISSDGLRNLSVMMEVNGSIEKLRMNDNSIGFDGCRAFSNALIFNDGLRLRELEMAQNALGDDGAEALCSGLAGCGTLTYVNLDGNRIHDDGASALGDMLIKNKVILTLSLQYNKIGALGAKKLGEALQRNCAVRTLSLNSNPLGSGGLEEIGKMLRLNDTLTRVGLGYAQVLNKAKGGNGLFVLNQALRVNRSLNALDLSGNDFTEPDLRNLLISLYHLDNQIVSTRKRNIALFELKMDDNHFNGEWLMRDAEVNFSGFDALPSIPLYCRQNRELWANLAEEKKLDMRNWLRMKKIKRKQADQRKKERKAALDARLAAQKRALNPQPENSDHREEEELARKAEEKRLRKLLKRQGKLESDGGNESMGGIEGLSADEIAMLRNREKQIQVAGVRGGRALDLEDDASISSLGSADHLKGAVFIGEFPHLGGDDNASLLSSVTGGENSLQIIAAEGASAIGGRSIAEGSIMSLSKFGREDVDAGSWSAPTIDSDFLMSMRGSLFGDGSSSGGGTSLEKRDRFYKSGIYSVTESEEETLGASLITASVLSDDQSSTSIGTTAESSATMSFSKNSAASWLVEQAANEEEGGRGDALGSSSGNSIVTFGKPPLPNVKPKIFLPGENDSGAENSAKQAKEKKTKLYAREEGEWRKDRTWISQRALDRTARKIAEEKARQEQIARQKEEDIHIGKKVLEKEEVMARYFKMDDGIAMIQAVADELRDLRKVSFLRKYKRHIPQPVRSCSHC